MENRKSINGKSARHVYSAMEGDRAPYLRRARDVASLTIPSLLPEEGNSGSDLPTPYQSLGARGLSSLASKLMLALFPPSQSFTRLKLEDSHAQVAGSVEGAKEEIDTEFGKIERKLTDRIESDAIRPPLYEGLRHFLAAGNSVIQLPRSGGAKVYPLDRYVCKRDTSGELLLLITTDGVSPTMLPPAVRAILDEDELAKAGDDSVNLCVYTVVLRDSADKFCVWQEIHDKIVPGSEGDYDAEHLPWIVLGDAVVSGESYGYGYIASQLGDLSSLEGLMKALVEASAASARVIFLVNPASSVNVGDLNKAPNGSFVTGGPEDVVALKVDKASDMGTAFAAIEKLQQSLGFAFLLNQSVQRSGERVTAEEIRFLAQELEDVHAGLYSMLSQKLQLPLARVYIHRLSREGVIPKLDSKVVKLTIVTGLEALGRGHDLQRLDEFVRGLAELTRDQLGNIINLRSYARRRATALSLDTGDLIISEEQAAATQQASQQQAMAESVAPEVVRQVGNAATQPAQ